MGKRLRLLLLFMLTWFVAQAQDEITTPTHQDTLKGSVTPQRAWWDVLRYDLTVQPHFTTHTIEGKNEITYRVVKAKHTPYLQVDLQPPLKIDRSSTSI
jgi:hypothetical protein